MCGLAARLLQQTPSALLRTCSRVAGLKPTFAELLLPHVFVDMAGEAVRSCPLVWSLHVPPLFRAGMRRGGV